MEKCGWVEETMHLRLCFVSCDVWVLLKGLENGKGVCVCVSFFFNICLSSPRKEMKEGRRSVGQSRRVHPFQGRKREKKSVIF